MHVGWAQTKHERQRAFQLQEKNQKNETKVYIRDIRDDVSKEQVCEILSTFGEIESGSVKSVQAVGKSLKFAMVNFKDKEAA